MIRYGVFGCGGHVIDSHIKPALDTDFILSAVYDPKPANAKRAMQAAGRAAATFTSPEKLLKYGDVEVVLIGSPDKAHANQLLLAVEAGKHVLVDKPLAINEAGVATVRKALALALAHRKELIVTSCHPRRFDPPYQWLMTNLRKLITQYGEVMNIALDFSYPPTSSPWKQARSLLLDHFSHEIDYIRALLGDMSFVVNKVHDSPHAYRVAGILENNITFVFSGTRRLTKRVYPETIHVRLERGECTINTKTEVAFIYDHETFEHRMVPVTPTDYDLRFALLMKNFAHAVKGEIPNYLSPADLLVNTESAIALLVDGTYTYISR